MKIASKEVEDNKIQIDVRLDKSKVEQYLDEVAGEFQPRVKVRGFRPGKAPLNLVRSHYRKEVLGEASTRMIYQGTSEALRERELRNVSNPVLLDEFRSKPGKQYIGQLHLDGSFSFSVIVEAPPELDVQGYDGVEIEVDVKDFDGWFKRQIKDRQMLYGEKALVERPAKTGDEVIVDFEGLIDGQPFEGSQEESYRLLIGEENFFVDFENSFIGHSAGDRFSVSIRFPDAYFQEELAGRTVDFKCALHEVYELVPHELNDELAQLLSYDSVDAMMEADKEAWDQQFSETIRAQIFSAIMTEVSKANEFSVPDAWVETEIKNTMNRLDIKETDNEFAAASIREMSENTVKVAFLLDKIYEKETDIHLTAEELKAIAAEEAKKQGIPNGETLIENLKQSGRYEGFVTYHEQQKVIDFLIERTVIKEKE